MNFSGFQFILEGALSKYLSVNSKKCLEDLKVCTGYYYSNSLGLLCSLALLLYKS